MIERISFFLIFFYSHAFFRVGYNTKSYLYAYNFYKSIRYLDIKAKYFSISYNYILKNNLMYLNERSN